MLPLNILQSIAFVNILSISVEELFVILDGWRLTGWKWLDNMQLM